MLSTCCIFPPSDNVISVDNKGPIVRFTEQLKLSICAGCCDVWWENTSCFPKVKASLQSKPLGCRAEKEKLVKGNLNLHAMENDLWNYTLADEIKQKTETKEDSCDGVG